MKSLSVFILLQAIDLLTTLVALKLGGAEQNPMLSQIMNLAPTYGLLLSKFLVVGIAALGVWMHKSNGLRVANMAFAGIVVWNFGIIFKLAIPG